MQQHEPIRPDNQGRRSLQSQVKSREKRRIENKRKLCGKEKKNTAIHIMQMPTSSLNPGPLVAGERWDVSRQVPPERAAPMHRQRKDLEQAA